MPWLNPAIQRCRAELALHIAVRVFERFHIAQIPDKAFNHQLTKCLKWHYECTKALPAYKIPAELWKNTQKRVKVLEPYFNTVKAKNHDLAAEQMCVLAGVAAMLIIDVLVSCPDYYGKNWRYLSDVMDTFCNGYLFPLFPEAEEQASRLWMKIA